MDNIIALPLNQRHILVPIDFSDHSREALRAAGQLFLAGIGGRITLLAVVEPPTTGLRIQTEDIHKQMMVEADRNLKEWVREELPEVESVNTGVVAGEPRDEICEEAAKRNVDLIVISTHGRTGLKRYLMGSVAEHVVRQAPCSVLIVR